MRVTLVFPIICIAFSPLRTGAAPSAYFTGSVGETIREINNSGSPLTGIYHFGAKASWGHEYWDMGVLLESGIFNRYPAVGSLVEMKLHYPFFERQLQIGFGGGYEFQSYYRGNYRRQFETTQRYTYREAPVIIGQFRFLGKYFAEYQKNFDDMIFWKFRVGYRFWN